MTVEPAVLIAAIAALGGLLVVIVRLFLTGAILPRSAVPREDYDSVVVINASYAGKFGEQTEAIRVLSAAVAGLVSRPVRR